MPEVLWLQTARADLMTVVDYISDDNPNAAQRIKDDIEAHVGKLSTFPKMGRKGRVDGTRELVISSNYIVVYQDGPERIGVLRILHAAQQWPPGTE